MNYQGRRRGEEKPRSSRTSLVMQNFNTRDWRGLTCWGVMSAIDWLAVGCLCVRPHWHSLILRWRELVVDVPGIPRLSGSSLFFFSPFPGRNRNGSSSVLAAARAVACKCKGNWSPSSPPPWHNHKHTPTHNHTCKHTQHSFPLQNSSL